MPELPGQCGVSDSNPEDDQLAARRKKSSPVDKTILEVELQETTSDLPASKGIEAGNDPLEDRRKKAPPVDKTKLDMDAVLDMASKTVAEKDDKLREELEARPVEPVKPIQPIEKFRPATPCRSSWDKMTGSGTVRFCEQCKLQVYDFSETELADAEVAVFKREGKKNIVLYRREDGKFLTADCPVAVKNRQMVMVAGIVAAALAAGCVIVLASVQQSQPGAHNVTINGEKAQAPKMHRPSSIESSSDGWVTITVPQSTSTKPAATESHSAVLGPSQSNPAQNIAAPSTPLDYQGQMPLNSPVTSGQSPDVAETARQTTSPIVRPESGQSNLPGTAPAISTPVVPIQPSPVSPGTVAGSEADKSSIPAGRDPAATTDGTPSSGQSSPQPGVWQRPIK